MTIANMEAAISLRGMKLQHERFALGPVDCSIPKGMVTAIVGPNGSGKSTLFRALLGLEPVRAGEIEMLGTLLDGNQGDQYKSRIGFLAENPHAHESHLTANEKAKFASNWYPSWEWERYNKLLRHFDVDGGIKLSKMSKGMRRKAELSIAMAHDPDLLLLDEPSSGLDPFAWKTMLEELGRYMEPGDRTLVLATHILEEIKRLADYILFIYRGKVLGLYEKDRLLDDWRTIVVQIDYAAKGGSEMLQRAPGFQGLSEAGAGLYRLEVDDPERGEAYCRDNGFRVVAVQRMELEDILSCLIRKEEARR
ncbi:MULTISPECIES: ATP-binding cassette domain-containing protein [Cohnella]|uniref:ABC-2 type transport system ATP-binding protein n=1 Tax=Cohnella phaseoli TaxID=456490 RepID=A0A3D9KHN1_9BACL|nr:ABC transporter ATP-binding protein [Cohnella phaseoli]RED85384.1 ABC-2 type transport system ATP-binding protein [Cohnella phaseoli]